MAQERAYGTTRPDLVTEDVGIDQNLDRQLDLDLELTAQNGETHKLRDFFLPGRPLIIAPVYYGCPRLCGYTLNGVTKLINEQKFVLGQDYKVLAISFDDTEGPELAREKAQHYYAQLTNPERGEAGWNFLTGKKDPVVSLMTQLGFRYKPDEGEFSHAAGIMVITPEGRISRYFYGIEYPESDVRYTLVEAARGRIGGIVEHMFLYCFRFDPTKGKYTLVVWNMTRAVCAIVVFVLASLLITLRMKENGRKRIP
ncbi:MAG: SCO family protein [Bdellovibrionota bacterium]